MVIESGNFQNIARAISGYTDEAYTNARKLSGTNLFSNDARISSNGEDYYGTIRYYKPLNPVINIADESSSEGLKTDISTDFAEYIKTYRTHGADQYLLQSVLSGQDGLAKIARDFGETRAQDEDDAVRSVLRGVALAEVAVGNSALTANVDIKNYDGSGVGLFRSRGTESILNTAGTTASQKLRPLIELLARAFSDYEASSYYLHIDPETYIDLRAENLVDDNGPAVTEGNIEFETMLSGKIRLFVTRSLGQDVALSNFGSTGAIRARVAGATAASTDTVRVAYLTLPGVFHLAPAPVVNPVAIDRDESVGFGSGSTEAWYRWSYLLHARGYTWGGSKEAFASNANYSASGAWVRKSDIFNLGIVPIFHSALIA